MFRAKAKPHLGKKRERVRGVRGLPAGGLYPSMSQGEQASQQHTLLRGKHSMEPGAPCLPWGLPVGLEPPTCNIGSCHLLRGYPTG